LNEKMIVSLIKLSHLVFFFFTHNHNAILVSPQYGQCKDTHLQQDTCPTLFFGKIKSYLTVQFSLLIGTDEERDWAAIIYGPIRTYRRRGAVPKAADDNGFMPDPDKEMAMLGETAKNVPVFNLL